MSPEQSAINELAARVERLERIIASSKIGEAILRDERNRRIVAMYEAGSGPTAIAAATGLHRETVMTVLKREMPVTA